MPRFDQNIVCFVVLLCARYVWKLLTTTAKMITGYKFIFADLCLNLNLTFEKNNICWQMKVGRWLSSVHVEFIITIETIRGNFV